MNRYSIIISIFILIFFLAQPHIYCYEETIQSPKDKKSNQKTIVVTSRTIDSKHTGLRVYNPEKFYNGYTLIAPISDPKEPLSDKNTICLIDMEGNIVHEWIAETPVLHARLESNGFILYETWMDICEHENNKGNFIGLRELDTESNVVWEYPNPTYSLHDFQILNDGNFLIEDYETVPYKPSNVDFIKDKGGFYKQRAAQCMSNNDSIGFSPRIKIITRRGKVIWSWRGIEHISELEKLTGLKIQPQGDWAHNNTCEMLRSNPLAKIDSRFRKGNILFSFAELDIIGIIEYTTGKIVWTWGSGELDAQHTPTMLDNGNFLIFDNGHRRRWSRIIELNPLTEKIVWEYHATPTNDFCSRVAGSNMQLPNGNILICSHKMNRIFEITREGEIVWDIILTLNKTRTGTFQIYRAYRYSPEYVKPLLKLINKQ